MASSANLGLATPTPSSSKTFSTTIGHGLAKALGIQLQGETEYEQQVTRGESVHSMNTQIADVYIEPEPTVVEYFSQFRPTLGDVGSYTLSLFPFLTWLGRYNLKWAYGDIVAGITVGCVVIPQGMAYAQLALLPPEYGLYSSFVGVSLYWFFATSKDITIGPVAVMSTLVGNIVEGLPTAMRPQVASSLALAAGLIVFGMGILRLGFIVDYIPLTAIAAFMTGSALNIAVGQMPKMMGITGFNTRDSTYKVFINFLKNLGHSKIDAAMGLTALFLLYLLRWIFTSFLPKRYPRWQKTCFFFSTLRTAFVILLYTLISYVINRDRRLNPVFHILETVPRGFKHMGVPKLGHDTTKYFISKLPVTVIVLLIEHIAISKSFGRVNNYTINPSQELVAIGITNIFGPFFGAYPATGSFSRTAIKSKAGVRTPFAGVITGIVVLLALYCLTAVFYYIPDASLSAVIIHAVGDLITPPDTVYKFWRVSPIECIIFFAGVTVTVFSSIEDGIYVAVGVSGGLLLFRIAKARGHFLGRVKVHSLVGDSLLDGKGGSKARSSSNINNTNSSFAALDDKALSALPQTCLSDSGCEHTRNVFLPIDHYDGSNPSVDVIDPYPGVFVYRFSEGFLYPNATHYTERLVQHIFTVTKRGTLLSLPEPGDRPWNDPGPRNPQKQSQTKEDRPTLKAIVLDFSSVNNVDITSVQNLIDIRNQLDHYAAPDVVEWHFAAIGNRWTKRALSSAGFGLPPDTSHREGWKPVFSVAEVPGGDEIVGQQIDKELEEAKRNDPEAARRLTKGKKVVPVASVGRPFFHVDLDGAVESALRNVREY